MSRRYEHIRVTAPSAHRGFPYIDLRFEHKQRAHAAVLTVSAEELAELVNGSLAVLAARGYLLETILTTGQGQEPGDNSEDPVTLPCGAPGCSGHAGDVVLRTDWIVPE